MSDRVIERTRRLLVLVPAVWKAGERGLSLADAARITGASDEKQVEADLESLAGLSLAPSFPELEVMLELENGRIYAAYTMQLVDPPAFSLREGAALLAALRPFSEGVAVKSVARKLLAAIPSYLRPHAHEMARATDFQAGAPGEWADALLEAVDRRVEVTIEYRASATADAQRKVLEPRLVFPQGGCWYLAAWNVEKGEEHLYRLDRIVSVVLGERVFGAHRGPPLRRYARSHLYFQSGTERSIEIRFRNVAARIALERWPDSAVRRDDGSVVVTAKVTPGPYLYGWVLGFGADAEVVAPADVRASFLRHVEELRRAYAEPERAAAT
jgi:proteasome accessory factor C